MPTCTDLANYCHVGTHIQCHLVITSLLLFWQVVENTYIYVKSLDSLVVKKFKMLSNILYEKIKHVHWLHLQALEVHIPCSRVKRGKWSVKCPWASDLASLKSLSSCSASRLLGLLCGSTESTLWAVTGTSHSLLVTKKVGFWNCHPESFVTV